jgi:hypothetical protein
LPGGNVEGTAFILDMQYTSEHDRNFFELRALPRFFPAGGRDHSGYADGFMFRVYPTSEFLDALRFCTCSLDDRWNPNKLRHTLPLLECLTIQSQRPGARDVPTAAMTLTPVSPRRMDSRSFNLLFPMG